MRDWFRRLRLRLARWRAVPGKRPGYWPVKAIQPWQYGEGMALDPGTGRRVSSSVPYGSVQCPICKTIYEVRCENTFVVWCPTCEVDLW